MPIIINHNLCDEAPECGGIEVCPTGAFYFDEKAGKVAIDRSKCTQCLKCTLPDACPVGCILYARNKEEEDRIQKRIKQDPRTAAWLWQERYGCQEGKTPPLATIITDSKLDHTISEKGWKLIDVWSEQTLDCRAYSTLFSDLLKGVKVDVAIYKLDAWKYPHLAKQLKVKTFPTLLLYQGQEEIWRHEGLIKGTEAQKVNKKLRTRIESMQEQEPT